MLNNQNQHAVFVNVSLNFSAINTISVIPNFKMKHIWSSFFLLKSLICFILNVYPSTPPHTSSPVPVWLTYSEDRDHLPPSTYRQEPYVYRLPPTAYCLPPTTYCLCLLTTTYLLLPTAYCLPTIAFHSTAYHQEPSAYLLPPTAYCPLITASFSFETFKWKTVKL
jgi:hypothetical protein